MKIKVFHGTTKENYLNILKNGFSCGESVWNCSNLDETYFYNFNKIKEGEELEDEETKNKCIEDCLINAQITASVQNSKFNDLFVFEIEIDEKYIYDDYSCENMAYASCCPNDELNEFGTVKHIYKSEAYDPSFKLLLLNGGNKYLNLDNLTETEQIILKQLNEKELFIEELLELCNDWEEVTK